MSRIHRIAHIASWRAVKKRSTFPFCRYLLFLPYFIHFTSYDCATLSFFIVLHAFFIPVVEGSNFADTNKLHLSTYWQGGIQHEATSLWVCAGTKPEGGKICDSV